MAFLPTSPRSMCLQQKRMPKSMCDIRFLFSIFPLFGNPAIWGKQKPFFSFKKKTSKHNPLNQVVMQNHQHNAREVQWAPLVADRSAAAFPKAHVSHEALGERIFDCLNFFALQRGFPKKFWRRKMPEKTLLDYPRFPEEKFRRNHNSWMSTNLSLHQFLVTIFIEKNPQTLQLSEGFNEKTLRLLTRLQRC